MTISDERLAEMVGAGVPCVPAQPGEIAAVVQELRAVRAASITPPAPERSKEEVLSVADAMAQLEAAIEAEKQRNAVRDEMLATVIVNIEKSDPTAEFAQNLRDYVREERAKLSALSKPGEQG